MNAGQHEVRSAAWSHCLPVLQLNMETPCSVRSPQAHYAIQQSIKTVNRYCISRLAGNPPDTVLTVTYDM